MNTQKGSMSLAISGVVVVLIAVIGGIYFFTHPAKAPNIPADEIVQETANPITGQQVHTVPVTDRTASPASNTTFNGKVLAGSSAPLLDFTKEDFDTAVAANKLIVLYFYANWCPICRAEFPKAEAAFDELTTDQVVGFRVNFNDNETDEFEKALAREHGVAYQHTVVIIQGGKQVLKSPEPWQKDRYLSEIQSRL